MDSNFNTVFGSVEYYLNRLVQRALVEPKSLLKIYEEECQRHPDISVSVTFREFQAALRRHSINMQTHHQAVDVKPNHQDFNYLSKERNARFMSLSESIDQRTRRRSDLQGQGYQKINHSVLERFSPQGSYVSKSSGRHNIHQSAALIVKSESPGTPVVHPQAHSSRPPSVQPPVEEEAPPEFIEMSSNPPRLSNNTLFAGLTAYQNQLSGEEKNRPTTNSANYNVEPKETSNNGTVQSSSPLNKNTVLSAEDVSPLNVRCVKCITALVTCAAMPCGHCCLCNICGQTVLSLKQVCPVCRKSITTVIGYSNLIYNVYR